MATSAIDQKQLGRVARDVGFTHPALSKHFYQVLGLSLLLSEHLLEIQGGLKVVASTGLPISHHILWLSHQGLAITENCILPLCQVASQPSRCQVMAAKLKASFYHLFCLFHNDPPVSSLPGEPSERVPGSPLDAIIALDKSAGMKRVTTTMPAGLPEPVSSLTSDASYITNPWPQDEPVSSPQSPLDFQGTPRNGPLLPPGLGLARLISLDIPISAEYILPALNFIPAAASYFAEANAIAEQSLKGCDPLRLSIAYESCLFTLHCTKDLPSAKMAAVNAMKAGYQSCEGMGDDFVEDAAALGAALRALVGQVDLFIGASTTPTPCSGCERVQSSSPRMRSAKGSPLQLRKLRPKRSESVVNGSQVLEKAALREHTNGTIDCSSQRQSSSVSSQSVKEWKRRKAELAEQTLEHQRGKPSQATVF